MGLEEDSAAVWWGAVEEVVDTDLNTSVRGKVSEVYKSGCLNRRVSYISWYDVITVAFRRGCATVIC